MIINFPADCVCGRRHRAPDLKLEMKKYSAVLRETTAHLSVNQRLPVSLIRAGAAPPGEHGGKIIFAAFVYECGDHLCSVCVE